MIKASEILAFGGLAVLLHVAFFALAPQSGSQSSGAGGEAMISIQAADATIAELVATWERPVETQQQLETQLQQATVEPVAPTLPQFDLAIAPRAAVQTTLPRPEADEALSVDTSVPPPPPPPEPKPEPRPDPVPTPAKEAPAPPPNPAPPREQPRKAEQTSAGRAEQRAAGSGGGANAGSSGAAEVATGNPGQQAKLQSIWGAKIRARIERRKRYPAGARGEGRVVVRLVVSRTGQLISSSIVKSSGTPAFDQAALKAIARAGKFPSAPKKLELSQLGFTLPMSFRK